MNSHRKCIIASSSAILSGERKSNGFRIRINIKFLFQQMCVCVFTVWIWIIDDVRNSFQILGILYYNCALRKCISVLRAQTKIFDVFTWRRLCLLQKKSKFILSLNCWQKKNLFIMIPLQFILYFKIKFSDLVISILIPFNLKNFTECIFSTNQKMEVFNLKSFINFRPVLKKDRCGCS